MQLTSAEKTAMMIIQEHTKTYGPPHIHAACDFQNRGKWFFRKIANAPDWLKDDYMERSAVNYAIARLILTKQV